MHLYTDPITKEQHLIFPVGIDGIVSGRYNPESHISVTFDPQTETGSGNLASRPLAFAEMDGHVYMSGGPHILK